MAASKEWFEFHLTPRGWEEGSKKTDSAPVMMVTPPSDRFLTVQVNERMPFSHSRIQSDQIEIWRSSDSASVAALIKKYGPSPQ